MNTKVTKIDKNDFIQAKIHIGLTPGEALEILRTLQGLSQLELAKITGLSQPNISALENNRANMGRETAIKLAHALKVHPGVLLFPDFDIGKVAYG